MKLKLKFMLVPLAVFGLDGGSYGDCSKDEILKLINQGFTKTKINVICGKNEKKESKWIKPSNKVCKSNDGKVNKYGCKATWENAKDICFFSGGSLPNIDELKELINDCGGEIKGYTHNVWSSNMNSSYQSCYQRKGFLSFAPFWSSTGLEGYKYHAWAVDIAHGHKNKYFKGYYCYVNCMRDE